MGHCHNRLKLLLLVRRYLIAAGIGLALTLLLPYPAVRADEPEEGRTCIVCRLVIPSLPQPGERPGPDEQSLTGSPLSGAGDLSATGDDGAVTGAAAGDMSSAAPGY